MTPELIKKGRGVALLICAAFALTVGQFYAAEIPGTVKAVNAETITVATVGDDVPNVGDKAEIFFKLAGVEGEIFVATGSVVKVEGDSIQVKIEKATGEVAKDQLVHGVKFVPGALGFISGRDNQTGPLQSLALPSGAYTDATRSTVVGLVIGDDVRLFIDEKCVANFRIDRPSEGRGFQLLGQSVGGSPCTFYFDNWKIYAASTAAKTSGEKKSKPRKR